MFNPISFAISLFFDIHFEISSILNTPSIIANKQIINSLLSPYFPFLLMFSLYILSITSSIFNLFKYSYIPKIPELEIIFKFLLFFNLIVPVFFLFFFLSSPYFFKWNFSLK